MDTKNLKAYAPQARRDFIAAVTKRAAQFGLYENRIADVVIEGSSAIIEGRVFTRKQAMQRGQLASRINELGFNQFINEAAFTWVNRLTAIRYMEVNGYLEHGFRILSMPPKKDANDNDVTAKFGQGFEVLAHAADVAEHLELDKPNIVKMLLAGDKEEELYREILLGECHQLNKVMPFMFEKLNDATELLLPDNLTKTDSILKELVDKIPETDWQDIEVIGWLYQFYISEHKDSVMGKVVKKEDIPAATQLFTPNWIVKYLVQNSVGRHWVETYPESGLKDKMEYYIAPTEQSDNVIDQLKAIVPTSIDPETIKVLDPACGSGHILVEVYEVLREIYLERGYRLREIPELILTKNIYGLDIDDRAAQMAAFAILMKAREDDRRIFDRVSSNDIKLNIYALQSTEHLDINQLWADLDLEGKQQAGSMSGLFDQKLEESTQSLDSESGEYDVYLDLLRYLKNQFIDAKNLGSLIDVNSKYLVGLLRLHDKLLDKSVESDTVATPAAQHLLPIVKQAILLSTRYDAVIANPPYMGAKGMNSELKAFAKDNYPDSKLDLFAIFMERGFGFLNDNGYNAQVNMQSWMFLSSYQKMRESLLDTKTFITMAHLGARAFGQISGEVVQTTAWVLKKIHIKDYQPVFFRLIDGGEEIKKTKLLAQENRFDQVKQSEFSKIPGNPIAYWVSNQFRDNYNGNKIIKEVFKPAVGLNTGDNDRFLKYWFEVRFDSICRSSTNIETANESDQKWFPYNKGGTYRKWYGNQNYILNWSNDGKEVKDYAVVRNSGKHWSRYIQNLHYMLNEGVTWSDIATGSFAARYTPSGFFFDVKGSSGFPSTAPVKYVLGLLCSNVMTHSMKALNPTATFQVGDLGRVCYIEENVEIIKDNVSNLIDISKDDWDSFEISMDFEKSPLLGANSIENSLNMWKEACEVVVSKTKKMEEDNNKLFIDSYGLSEFTHEVSSKQITLTANPEYRYSNLKVDNLQSKVTSDSLYELISYSIGCMMGRYSLDRKGLVYADSKNEGFKELTAKGAYNTFEPDDDSIIPLASETWLFDDDATVRFREFVKTVWGDEHLQENLDFVAKSLCLSAIKPKNGEGSLDTLRRYFSTQFYKDHLKTYKKRPIYWLFSSGKEKAFECLVYLHRYNEGTLSRMRTEYVTPLMGKFESQTSILRDERDTATSSEQRRIDKELKSIEKKQAELNTFDQDLS